MNDPISVMTIETEEHLNQQMADVGYLSSNDLTTTLLLAQRLKKPLLLEGAPGAGKTSVAQALAKLFKSDLIRLQCYEGLDASSSLYEWNHAKQILHIRLVEAGGAVNNDAGFNPESVEKDIFTESYLLARPLLQAIKQSKIQPTVLLIDEIDRADEEFEAFLLEVLSEYQITIPEFGAIKTQTPPLVILTSNGTRELSDALRRRCLYFWLDLPEPEQEKRIIQASIPNIEEHLAIQLTLAVNEIRALPLDRPPGVAETLDWAQAIVEVCGAELNAENLAKTRGTLVKSRADLATLAESGADIVSNVTGRIA